MLLIAYLRSRKTNVCPLAVSNSCVPKTPVSKPTPSAPKSKMKGGGYAS